MKSIDGAKFREMIISGADNLRQHAGYVDSLNVFPVPDGDTGTNMNLSMTSGASEVEGLDETHIGEVGKYFSKGLLMGARGNSGVILSQLFRGFSKAIVDEATLDARTFASALDKGVKTAYKAVMKPVEGTILTVAKDSANIALESTESDDVVELMTAVIKEAKASLKRTPDLLPVLKEVGVVDSGGQGLVYVYEGFLAALKGQTIAKKVSDAEENTDDFVDDHHEFDDFMTEDEIEFGYCTEFMVRFQEDKRIFDEDTFRNEMSDFGDSLLVISDEEIVKVHVHTETPGEAFTYGATYGELLKVKVENMREQFREIQKKKESKKQEKKSYDTAVITVSAGDGIKKIFESMGATHVISGGQTMNPSTQDIVDVVKNDDVKNIIVLPNNKNIIMAAEQAKYMVDVELKVIPTKSIPHGLAALVAFSPDVEIDENVESMMAALEHLKTGQVTHAVRDTTIDGVSIKKDQHMGIADGKIIASKDSREDTLTELILSMLDEDSEIITVLIGEDGSEVELERVIERIEEENDEVEFEVHAGDQPVYSYLLSVE